MATSISSAEPQELKRYAEITGRIDAHLGEEAARLSGILGHFASRCTEYSTGVGAHTADRLRSYAHLCSPNDEWVRQVGRDFELADSRAFGWTWTIPLSGPAIRPANLDGHVIGTGEFQSANDTTQQVIDDACSWVMQQADRYRQAIAAAKEAPQVCTADPTYQEPEKSFLDQLLDFIFGDSDRIKEYLQQLRDGFEKARQALQREWEGFVDVVKKFTPDWIEDVATAIYKVSEQIGGFFVGFAEAAYETITGLVTLVVDVVKVISGDEETRQKYLAIIEAFKTDPIGTTKLILESIAEPIVEDWKAGRYGEAVGRVTFEVLPTILALFTGGATGAAYASKLGKAGKVADALADTGRVMGKLDDAGKIVNKLDDAGKAADKLSDAGKTVDKISDTSKAIDVVPGQRSPVTRPSWRQSELDIGDNLTNKGFKPQQSFKDGVEVPYGTKGSSRPEYYRPGDSVEVKNYDISSSQNRTNLANNISEQAKLRLDNLPSDTRQTIIIDMRGQDAPQEILDDIAKQISTRSDGSITPNDVKFIRENEDISNLFPNTQTPPFEKSGLVVVSVVNVASTETGHPESGQ